MVLKVQRRIEIAQAFGVGETRDFTITNHVLRAQGDALLAARTIYLFIRTIDNPVDMFVSYSLDDGVVFIDRGTVENIPTQLFTTIPAIGTHTRISILAPVGATVDVTVQAV